MLALPPPDPDTTRPPLPARPDPGAGDAVLEMVLAGLAEQTRAGYRKDLAALARWLGLAGPAAAVTRLLGLTRGEANALATAYAASMLQSAPPLAPATVRRRFAAIARVFKAGRRFDLTEVTPEAELPRTERNHDRDGPGKRGWERMLAAVTADADAGRHGAVRDRAAVLLLHDRALRRGELAGLDWPSGVTDFPKAAVLVLGKGRREKEWLTVSDRALAAVRAWAAVRGDWGGPLFVRHDRAAGAPERLSGHGVNGLVKALGWRAGLPRAVRAHGLRHQAITEALDQGWSVRDTMAFSRHLNPKQVIDYDTRRADVGGEIARALGGDRAGPRRKG